MKSRYLNARDVYAAINSACPDVPRQSVAEWCSHHLYFDEASYRGPFRTDGHEYWKEVLELWNRSDVSDVVLVAGSQTRKTGTLMGGVAWCLVNDPCGFLWVLPNKELARKVSRQRFSRMLKRSKPLAPMIPKGRDRHSFATLEMLIGSSVINFVGSNSAANLASNPCRRVVLDEVDKFNEGTSKESDAVNLAEQRTKDQPSPQRWKTSTPTTEEGLIWREFLNGDRRRYFIPCPACGKHMVLAWSKQFTVLPPVGCEAYVQWDQNAKRRDGTWDLERVEKTAGVSCPHCGVVLMDSEKAGMVAKGEWRPTHQASAPSFRSYHLSSLYATSPETTWGKLAVKFLQMKDTLQGLQGFINGDLAEPYLSQDISQDRRGLVTHNLEVTDEWQPLLTVDCQAKSPSFWYVVRVWKGGNSRGIDAGSLDTWEEIESKQAEHKIDPAAVFIDSGYGARSDAEVYQRCAEHSDKVPFGSQLTLVGWMPVKGQPGRKRWQDPRTKLMVPWFSKPIDPYTGTSLQGQLSLELLEYAGDAYKDILDQLRRQAGGFEWSIAGNIATDEYWRHMNGEVKTAVRNKFTGITKWQWMPRHKTWPNHLLDCEVMQVVAAHYLELFKYEEVSSDNARES